MWSVSNIVIVILYLYHLVECYKIIITVEARPRICGISVPQKKSEYE